MSCVAVVMIVLHTNNEDGASLCNSNGNREKERKIQMYECSRKFGQDAGVEQKSIFIVHLRSEGVKRWAKRLGLK